MKKYLLLVSDPMSDYTLQDVAHSANVRIINRCHATGSALVNTIFRLHTAVKLNKIISMPFKSVWYRLLLGKILTRQQPDYVVISSNWYAKGLLPYIRRKNPHGKIILKCGDKVSVALRDSGGLTEEKMRREFDGVIVYNPLDAEHYGFPFHGVGYSRVDTKSLPQYPPCDVVFIGAAKNRLEDIRTAYEKFCHAGLSCCFYVTGVPKEQRREDGIIYADKGMPFRDYLAREISAKCLFELVQEGSTGRTYRLMEAIIYNKMLITNCPEILQMSYFDPSYVQYFQKAGEIEPEWVKREAEVDHGYQGDFSPVHYLAFIDATFGNGAS